MPAGRRVGRFEILEMLGEGGTSRVFRARDPHLQRDVALKVLRTDSGPSAQRRFRQEAVATRALRHPGLVAVWEAGEADGVAYLAIELIDGGTLAERIDGRPVSPRQAAQWSVVLADALDHVHQQGVTHGDVTPTNVLLDRRGRPHLTDFGLARTREPPDATPVDRGPEEAGPVGTPAYMSPEQARGEPSASGPADQYGLGATLFAMLVGRPPHEGPVEQVIAAVAGGAWPSCERVPDVPRDLAAICRKAMAPAPDQRYGSVAEMRDDLQRWLDGESTVARPLSATTRAARWCRRQPATAAGIAAVALALLIATSVCALLARDARLRAAESWGQQQEAELAGEDLQQRTKQAEQTQRDAAQAADNAKRRRKEAEDAAGKAADAKSQTAEAVKRLEAALDRERKEADKAEQLAEAERDKQRALDQARARASVWRYYDQIRSVGTAVRGGQMEHAEALLEECEKTLRGWEWRRLQQMAKQRPPVRLSLPAKAKQLSLNMDGTKLGAVTGEDFVVWDLSKGTPLEVDRTRAAGGTPRRIVLSADGKQAAIATEANSTDQSGKGQYQHWRLGSPPSETRAHHARFINNALMMVIDGVPNVSGPTYLLDGKPLPGSPVFAVGCSPDGLTSGRLLPDGNLEVYSGGGGRLSVPMGPGRKPMGMFAIDLPRRRCIWVGHNTLYEKELATGRTRGVRCQLSHRLSELEGMHLTEDGVVVVSREGIEKIPLEGESRWHYKGRGTISYDGRMTAAIADGQVVVQERSELRDPSVPLHLIYRPAGTFYVGRRRGGTAGESLVQVETGDMQRGTFQRILAVSRDGEWMAVVHGRCYLKPRREQELGDPLPNLSQPHSMSLSDDGSRALLETDAGFHVWDRLAKRMQDLPFTDSAALSGNGALAAGLILPDGRPEDGELALWDIDQDRAVWRTPIHQVLADQLSDRHQQLGPSHGLPVAVSRHGDLVAAGGAVYNASTGELTGKVRGTVTAFFGKDRLLVRRDLSPTPTPEEPRRAYRQKKARTTDIGLRNAPAEFELWSQDDYPHPLLELGAADYAWPLDDNRLVLCRLDRSELQIVSP